MAQTILVTPEVLESTASSIEQLANEYKGQYNELYTTTGSLAQTWSGEDNVAFVNQIEGFKDDLEKMYTLMNRYAEYLRITAKAYRETQDAISKQARTLVN